MSGSNPSHWQKVYTDKATEGVSWYQESPAPSLEALDRLGAKYDRSLIDIGGGASNLVDVLLTRGWDDLTVLDISSAALDVARQRIGDLAVSVNWLVADITSWSPTRTYGVWHDRAVFHFLTGADDRAAYRERLARAVAPDGMAIIATFSPSGPERCSGLPVQRYDAAGLEAEFRNELELIGDWQEIHRTPSGSDQPFNWCLFKRR